MKIRKILAGMAASAIAMTTMAMVSAPTTASAAQTASGHAGITFQADGSWNYRNTYNNEDQTAAFPAASVGVQGGAYGIDNEATFGDVEINGDGTYTVTMATSGTLKIENQAAVDEGKSKWIADEASGINREGSKWSILHNFGPKTNDGSETLTKDNLDWQPEGDAKIFNILSVSTDIPVSFNAQGDDTPEDQLDKPVFDGRVVEVTDVVVNIQGQEYTPTEDVKFAWDPKAEQNYLTIQLIDKWNKNNTIDPSAFVTAEDGEISVTFSVKGLSAPEGGDESSSVADESSSAADSSSTASTASTTSTTSTASKAGTTSTASKAATTTTTTTSTTTAASDNTENAPAGAPAGIALALAAVAGAAVVVSRKR